MLDNIGRDFFQGVDWQAIALIFPVRSHDEPYHFAVRIEQGSPALPRTEPTAGPDLVHRKHPPTTADVESRHKSDHGGTRHFIGKTHRHDQRPDPQLL